ncbi:hypothetical protein O181_054186 [Austropuccinia psidii MF-1]|uniref:C2H2-type domain-containing protein n=1 Tax=Austropuccinia psidii MF-1 TaxID=1389203 RepID=A0A9Q3E212_9BASI|nr:hypothetical protein [Austropuccinia psidii MF-1]
MRHNYAIQTASAHCALCILTYDIHSGRARTVAEAAHSFWARTTSVIDRNNMSNNPKASAYGTPAAGTDFRKTWDKAEYEAKAKQRDEEERERMKEADAAMQKGKKPRRRFVELPKPTELMKQRDVPLDLDKNQNKTMIVQGSLRGPGAPGFYCDVCSKTLKDSSSYLDHLNSRFHLRQLGQKTQVAKSTLEQVRQRIAQLREETKQQTTSKQYDFTRRLKEIKEAEESEREAKRQKKLQDREKKAAAKPLDGVYQPAGIAEEGQGQDEEMARLLGFSEILTLGLADECASYHLTSISIRSAKHRSHSILVEHVIVLD